MELELYELCQVVAVGVGEQEEDQGEGVEHEDLVLEKPLEGVPDQLEAWRQLAFFCYVGRQSGSTVYQQDFVMRSNSYDKTLGLIQESISVISGIPSQKILCCNSILPHKHDCGDDMANRKDWKSEPPCVNAEAG